MKRLIQHLGKPALIVFALMGIFMVIVSMVASSRGDYLMATYFTAKAILAFQLASFAD